MKIAYIIGFLAISHILTFNVIGLTYYEGFPTIDAKGNQIVTANYHNPKGGK